MSQEHPLEGQVAIVTGAVRRIGKATALALAREGAAVVINARSSRDEAERVAGEVAAAGGRALVVLADVTDEAAVARMVAETVAAFGRVDILVNNAANRGESPFLEMSFQHWRDITGVILDGAFLCSRAVLPHMLANHHGRIVNIGGVSSHLGASERAHVGAAKMGLVGLTRALALEFATEGITVNCVVPGKIGGERSASSGRGLAQGPPVGREGAFDDVSNVIRMLCHPANGYITGQTIHVNGGLYMAS
ncbi:MAG: 3-oxoacyl-[acyl-carrier protein] reductase [Alphaproteobacteria bacterium]|nr:3-oxoacyl-[acyl-carrier protein] reductase [Alphaproteobacteria bacterium]